MEKRQPWNLSCWQQDAIFLFPTGKRKGTHRDCLTNFIVVILFDMLPFIRSLAMDNQTTEGMYAKPWPYPETQHGPDV